MNIRPSVIDVPMCGNALGGEGALCGQGALNNGVSAERVQIKLQSASSPGGFHCSLQHFLDVTGAGELYFRSASHSGAPEAKKGGQACLGRQMVSSFLKSGPASSCRLGGQEVPPADCGSVYLGSSSSDRSTESSQNSPPDCDVDAELVGFGERPLDERDIQSIVGGMWHENSLGDQAYFFPREDGAPPFFNGAIVPLVDGRLCVFPSAKDAVMYMVVSDNNAKWKGEPLPTPEEERLGHWCAFFGQVPVQVEGVVRCGDFIGPAEDGSGLGVVVSALGTSPVIGIALAGKSSEGVGAVKTLCFAGFNALTPLGSDFRRLFAEARRLHSSVEALWRNVEGCENSISAMHASAEERGQQLRSLEKRIEVVEDFAAPLSLGKPLLFGTAVEPHPRASKVVQHLRRATLFIMGVVVIVLLSVIVDGWRRYDARQHERQAKWGRWKASAQHNWTGYGGGAWRNGTAWGHWEEEGRYNRDGNGVAVAPKAAGGAAP